MKINVIIFLFVSRVTLFYVTKSVIIEIYLYTLPIITPRRTAGIGPHAPGMTSRFAPYPPIENEHHHPDKREHWSQYAGRVGLRHHLKLINSFVIK